MREAFGAVFDVDGTHLDTAAVGVPPRHVVDAVRVAVDDWAAGRVRGPDLDPPVTTARAGFAALVGVDPADVAIGGSASALVGLVAAAVPDGARVLVPADEFTSVSFPFAAQAGRGVHVEECPLDELPTRARDADYVAASVVQSADGRVLDLAALRAATEGTDTRVLLDATQALGWFDGPLAWADMVVASGYKWLLSPRGCAWAAVSERLLEQLVPHAANWYACDSPWQNIYGLPLRLAGDARRLDASPAWIPQVGASVALPWLASLDRRAVHEHCAGLGDALLTGLGLEPRGSAIVSLDLGERAEALAAAGIRVGARAGRTRVAFHLHADLDDVDRILDVCRDRAI